MVTGLADLHQRARQCDALGLAARELAQRPVDHGPEPEPLEDRAPFPIATHDIERGRVRIGVERRVGTGGLVEEHDAAAATAADRALLQVVHAGELAQQRRLPAPVESDHREPVACRQRQVEPVEERLAGPARGESCGVDEDHDPPG